MEGTLTPINPRSFIRRMFPWTIALGLFAGGGYGVYHYALPPVAGDDAHAAAADGDGNATKDSSANAQIKQLFASRPSAPSTDPYGDRYSVSATAPTLPPAQQPDEVATPRSAAAVTNTANPFATTPVGGYGDRYDVSNAAETTAPDDAALARPAPVPAASETPVSQASAQTPAGAGDAQPAAAESEAADDPAPIARGQEPLGDNPLRAAASRAAAPSTPIPSAPVSTSASDSGRAAFADGGGAAIVQPQELDLGPKPNKPEASKAGASAPASGRYGAGIGDGARPLSPAQPDLAVTSPPAVASPSATRSDRAGAFRAATPAPAPSAATDVANGLADSLRSDPAPPPPASLDESYPDADPGITPTPGLTAVEGAGIPGEKILEGVQAPALSIQKLAPQEIQVGKRCTFAVRVLNNSQRAAYNVQVRDEVPKGTQLVGAAPRADVNGSQVVWNLGTLSVGEERIVEMELLPTEEGDLGSVASVSFASQASAKVRCTRPELALRLSANPRVMIGQQQLVQVEISNPGTGDATGVMLLESVPTGVSHEAGPALEYPVGTLRAGESKQLELVLTAEAAGKVNNLMTARADANLEVQAGCEFEVIAPALDVSIEGPARRFLERPATYTVTINNPGTAAAKEVQLITQLPPGLQYVSANNMGEYDPATHSVTWSLAELPANEHGAVELTALPVEPGDHRLQVATRAQQGLEDRAETHVTVEGLVALSFEVAAVDGAIEVLGETVYDITVVNQGSKAATNVQVVAVTPPGIRALGGQGDSRYVVEGERVVFAPVPQLAPKAEAKFRVKVQGLRAGDQRTRVQVTTDEVREPITKELSTQVYADQ